MKDLSVVGKHVNRVDAKAKVLGDAVYTMDVKLSNMLYAKFIRSPHASARIISIDTSKAEAVEGVIAVTSYLNLIGKHVQEDIQDDRVRYIGEAVAGVAAITEEIAEEAVELIEVEYEVMPAVRNFEEAMKKDAHNVWPKGNLNTIQGTVPVENNNTIFWENGDVEKGFQESYAISEMTLRTHAQYHVCLEPHCCVMEWKEGMAQMNAWISTQTMYRDQAVLANLLNLPVDKVHIICPFVGGGFGGKEGNTCKEYLFTALLSVKARRPVRYEPTRAEETITGIRHPAQFYYKVGARKDGSITSVELKCIRDGGSFTSEQFGFMRGSTDFVAPCYVKSDNVRFEGWSVFTNTPICSAFRGFGYFESGSVLLQVLDDLAEKLEMDPIDFFVQNVPGRGDVIGLAQGPMTTGGVKDTLLACAEAAGWKEKYHKKGMKKLPDGRMHGIGVGYAIGRAYLPDFNTAGNAVIKVTEDGKALLLAGISDMGQGQASGLAQIAAEALGISYEDITVLWGDTIAPHSNFQAASATTMMTGNAVKLAAEDAKRQILRLAEPILKADSRFLDITNGIIHVKVDPRITDPKVTLPVEKLIKMPGIKCVIGKGHWSIREQEGTPRSLMVSIAEVAVDTLTGKTDVLSLVQGTDCGKIISRSRVEGQMESVLSGGLGYIFTEDWVMDERLDGRILNANLSDYRIPTFSDTMDILKPIVIMEDDDPIGPFGARGMGEATLASSAPAILNAIYNAIGVRIQSTPITPEKVLKAFGKL